MRRRKAPPRAQGTALTRTASRSRERCATGPTQVLRNRRPPSQEDQGTGCSAADAERLVFSIAYSAAMAVIFIQRWLNTGISLLKKIKALRKERLFMIFCLMIVTALAGACCGTSLLTWQLCGKIAPQVQPAADLRSQRNTHDVWKEHAGDMQQLRGDVTRLAAEMSSIKKEVQQMREAMSDPMDVSDWALRSAGTAIDLQRSSSTSAWFRRVFCFLCAPPVEDTFVQADVSPGYCWPLQQSRSEVLIRLPTEVQPTAITLQHASKIAPPLGTVRSAPQNFTVSGLDEEGQDETLLGSFIYGMQKEPSQSFPLQNGIPRAFRVLKLGIQSNWGNPRHTCIYRVQVHGKMVGTNAANKMDVETPLNKN